MLSVDAFARKSFEQFRGILLSDPDIAPQQLDATDGEYDNATKTVALSYKRLNDVEQRLMWRSGMRVFCSHRVGLCKVRKLPMPLFLVEQR